MRRGSVSLVTLGFLIVLIIGLSIYFERNNTVPKSEPQQKKLRMVDWNECAGLPGSITKSGTDSAICTGQEVQAIYPYTVSPIPTPVLTPDDWAVFVNLANNYHLKYLKKSGVSSGCGGGVGIANTQSTDYCDYMGSRPVNINVLKNPKKLLLDDFILETEGKYIYKHPVVIAGRNAFEVNHGPNDSTSKYYLSLGEDKILVLEAIRIDYYLDIVNSLTFFSHPETNAVIDKYWTEFNNSEYGIKFRYPSQWLKYSQKLENNTQTYFLFIEKDYSNIILEPSASKYMDKIVTPFAWRGVESFSVLVSNMEYNLDKLSDLTFRSVYPSESILKILSTVRVKIAGQDMVKVKLNGHIGFFFNRGNRGWLLIYNTGDAFGDDHTSPIFENILSTLKFY